MITLVKYELAIVARGHAYILGMARLIMINYPRLSKYF